MKERLPIADHASGFGAVPASARRGMKRPGCELMQAIGDAGDQRARLKAHQQLIGKLLVARRSVWSDQRLDRGRHEHMRWDDTRVGDAERFADCDRTGIGGDASGSFKQLMGADAVEAESWQTSSLHPARHSCRSTTSGCWPASSSSNGVSAAGRRFGVARRFSETTRSRRVGAPSTSRQCGKPPASSALQISRPRSSSSTGTVRPHEAQVALEASSR